MIQRRIATVAVAAILAMAQVAVADMISVGSTTVQAGSTAEMIISWNGTAAMQGVNLNLLIGAINPSDPFIAPAGTPRITNVQFDLPGYLFSGKADPILPVYPANGIANFVYLSQMATEAAGTVSGSGNLARVTFDIAGLTGTWNVVLDNPDLGQPTYVNGAGGAFLYPTLQNGTFTVQAPEPGTLVGLGWMLLAGLGLGWRRMRRVGS